jgi:hypothetical protein
MGQYAHKIGHLTSVKFNAEPPWNFSIGTKKRAGGLK